ncbi:c-type cytochrome [Paraherbaspirillum soli]|uniref:C-type cytochrome n=1 Tax=Paraherbaspirillum soli TaxID=631222 RepID=A0ABW0MAT2_9BURK
MSGKPRTTISLAIAIVVASALALPVVAQAEIAAADFNPPEDAAMPNGPKGEAIRAGQRLLTDTHKLLPQNVGNGLNCTSCHLNGGKTQNAAPWVGIWGVFPEYRSRSGKVITLQERVNDCFQRSMNGKPLAFDSREMNAILSYMQWLSSTVPTNVSVKGRGFGAIDQKLKPDAKHGAQVYAEKCASCHAADGGGLKNPAGGYVFPPLWGADTFNVGAGMARTYTAAAFVKHNMPLGQGGSLSDQQALDIAEFFTHQPRPAYAGQAGDWPNGDRPKDARN